MDHSELYALINLIDDPDDEVYSQIKSKLVSYGHDVIPALEDVWENNSFGMLFQTRIEDIIHLIQFEDVRSGLHVWAKNGGTDLLDGVLLVNKYQYPDLDEEKIRKRIRQLTQDVWIEINDSLTGIEQVGVINHILYEIHNFSGNRTNFHAPQNSYLNNVLESHKGNPLLLSILYLLIAESLQLPIYGVNLPNHFVLTYKMPFTNKKGEDISFYINAFSRGQIFPRKEIDDHLKQLSLEPQDSFYEPCSNIDIIKRLLNNLVSSYTKLGYPDKMKELQELRDELNKFD